MTKEIILTISGIHDTDGMEDETIEIITPGQYYIKNGKHYVLFEEVMEGIQGSIRSILKFTDDRIELLRNGPTTTRMIFQRDKEYQTIYTTPMGPLSLSVYTEALNLKIGENQMNADIRYSLKADGQLISESMLHLNVCPKELKKI